MKRPNFFIIGAPKCGTTSLASWLAQHPQVFMSPRKEPHHFNTDMRNVVTPSRLAYEKLFDRVTGRHIAVGEASTWYLYSEHAVPRIRDYSPKARFVVCLRNPVEMAPALHEQCWYIGDEHVADFRAAWELREQRQQGRAVSRWCREPRQLSYGRACLLGAMVARLLKRVGRERVCVLFVDDLKRDPRAEYLRVLGFLGVPDDGRVEFPVQNAAKEPRSPLLQRIAWLGQRFKERMGITRSFGLVRMNTRVRSRNPLGEAMQQELREYFRRDIDTLGSLLSRDLSAWLAPRS